MRQRVAVPSTIGAGDAPPRPERARRERAPAPPPCGDGADERRGGPATVGRDRERASARAPGPSEVRGAARPAARRATGPRPRVPPIGVAPDRAPPRNVCARPPGGRARTIKTRAEWGTCAAQSGPSARAPASTRGSDSCRRGRAGSAPGSPPAAEDGAPADEHETRVPAEQHVLLGHNGITPRRTPRAPTRGPPTHGPSEVRGTARRRAHSNGARERIAGCTAGRSARDQIAATTRPAREHGRTDAAEARRAGGRSRGRRTSDAVRQGEAACIGRARERAVRAEARGPPAR